MRQYEDRKKAEAEKAADKAKDGKGSVVLARKIQFECAVLVAGHGISAGSRSLLCTFSATNPVIASAGWNNAYVDLSQFIAPSAHSPFEANASAVR